ncbi:DUF1929 domain-containing protein [Candidatus Saccharibacteria bacterium]|nr:DUF1929 domain-containing protein [Candidatus Saccharibacteria bacterium]
MISAVMMAGYITIWANLGREPIAAAQHGWHEHVINSHSYTVKNGQWNTPDQPASQKLDDIHTALLKTGKVFMLAGSGNNINHSHHEVYQAGIYDPETGQTKVLRIPNDMFCAGITTLSDGQLLIAGGTSHYEVLKTEVQYAGGVMTIKNESPDSGTFVLPKGTELRSPGGRLYRTRDSLRVDPATKQVGPRGAVTITASSQDTWVDAEAKGASSVSTDTHITYTVVSGLPPEIQSNNVYGVSSSTGLTLDKQEFAGASFSYLFDPSVEQFTKVDNLKFARWYPTTITLPSGRVLAISGLDQFGRILQGFNEVYDQVTQKWTLLPHTKLFPTYPAMFVTERPNTLLYTGGSAGYGSDKIGRSPGLWNWQTNAFQAIPGLRDSNMTETSDSLLLPPANAQRYMIAGGGGVGNSEKSTSRTDIVDLKDSHPRFTPGPDLLTKLRYMIGTILPDNTVLFSGGTAGYRANGNSYTHMAAIYDPATNIMRRVADSRIGRTYHSSAVLLPDGSVFTAGGDPLYSDAAGKIPGSFEQRIEIYKPPYMFQGERPVIIDGPSELVRGQSAELSVSADQKITGARLLRLGVSTHTTDNAQRSVELKIQHDGTGKLGVTLPKSGRLLMGGWYMLFVSNQDGVPSVARMVHVA